MRSVPAAASSTVSADAAVTTNHQQRQQQQQQHQQQQQIQHQLRQQDHLLLADACNKSKRNPFCSRCRNHGKISRVKGHKRHCEYRECQCEGCKLVEMRQMVSAAQIKRRRNQKQDEECGRPTEVSPPVLTRDMSNSDPTSLIVKTLAAAAAASSSASCTEAAKTISHCLSAGSTAGSASHHNGHHHHHNQHQHHLSQLSQQQMSTVAGLNPHHHHLGAAVASLNVTTGQDRAGQLNWASAPSHLAAAAAAAANAPHHHHQQHQHLHPQPHQHQHRQQPAQLTTTNSSLGSAFSDALHLYQLPNFIFPAGLSQMDHSSIGVHMTSAAAAAAMVAAVSASSNQQQQASNAPATTSTTTTTTAATTTSPNENNSSKLDQLQLGSNLRFEEPTTTSTTKKLEPPKVADNHQLMPNLYEQLATVDHIYQAYGPLAIYAWLKAERFDLNKVRSAIEVSRAPYLRLLDSKSALLSYSRSDNNINENIDKHPINLY